MVGVFRTLYEERFPFEELRVTPRSELDAHPTGDGNDTGVLRLPADHRIDHRRSASTPTGWPSTSTRSRTPTAKGDLVLPELASSYLDRDDVRPGMITPDGVVVRAFESIGWTWGGTWRSLKDYQHFSQNGR